MDTGDTAWVLASSAMVLLMTPGLAFFYGGLVRTKNVLATLMQSFMAMAIVGVVWVLWGYSLAFGPDMGGGIIGDLSYFGLSGVSATDPGPYAKTIPHQTFMIFQAMFAIITPALVTGAFAERIKFSAFVVFILLWTTIVYSPLAHWVWGQGGWLGLGGWGALDFAGGAVVHISSGFGALAAAIVCGRRLRHGVDAMDPHNIPFVVLGAGLLWFGWFGFNAGSALSSGGSATVAFVATNTAGCVAALTWTVLAWQFNKKTSVVGTVSGAIVGLAAVTPASGYIGVMPAIAIGLVAGAVSFAAVRLRTRMRVDDSLDVWAVHGVGGMLGILAVGLFAGVGFMTLSAFALPDVDRMGQIVRQLGAIGVAAGWGFGMTWLILRLIKATIGLRVAEADEEKGLDMALHGEAAYRS